MKISCISNLILAAAVCVSAQVVPASESQWSSNNSGTTASQNLHWGKPKVAGNSADNINRINQAIVNRTPSGIQQVEYIQQVQSIQPARPLTPAERDTLYPERRPQPKTPPSGATTTPFIPSNPPTINRSVETVTPPTQKTTSTRNNSSDSDTSGTSAPKVSSPSKLKNPSIPTENVAIQSGSTPAPLPNNSLSDPGRSSREIICPENAGFKSIKDISIDIRPVPTEQPKECPLVTSPYSGRHFTQSCYQWKASALCTKMAYFDDPQLERYGHSICPLLQPVISSAKFFVTVPLLPYKMGITPPNECVYTLGYYRPGNCAPYMLDPFPISIRAALFEAAAVGGAIAIIP